MPSAIVRPLALLAVVAACGDDPGRAGVGPPATTSSTGGTTGAATDDPTTTPGSTTDAATTSDVPTEPTSTTGTPLDACGGCEAGELCDPAQGCLDCASDGPCPEAVLYVAPDGAGSGCTYTDPCSLQGAQAVVRILNTVMTGEIRVYLRGGTYALSAPWVLTADDSGSGGHDVVWRAFPGEAPVLSGGVPVGPWRLVDPALNIHRAAVPGDSRHLWIGDDRAVRARGPAAPGFVETPTGYTAPDAAMAAWADITAVEVVGHRFWKSFRCPLAAVAGTALTVQDPCWTDAQLHKDMDVDFTLDLPQWFENARELLDEPGEFYLDRGALVVDHIPRAGVDLATAPAIVPVLETLLHGAGTIDAPLRHVRFEGLGFAHAGWLAPSGPQGYVELQAGIRLVGGGTWASEKTPAAVRFEAADHVTIAGCSFTHLGAGGLSFELGARDNLVVDNRFEDISAGAIQLGNVTETWHHHPDDPATIVAGNTIRSNFVTRTGVEYPSTVAIWAGYTEGARIEHNDLFDLPYTGISVGWGWGAVDVDGPTPASSLDNHIENNRVGYHMRVLEDGGGIYTLGAQQGSTTSGNYVHNQGHPYGALYLDNGTQHYTVSGNVVEKVDYWLLCTTYATDATNNTITGNYSELDNPFVQPDPPHPSNTIAGNVVFGAVMPPDAQAIVAAAGLLPEHRAMHPDELARGLPATASSIYDPTHPESQGNDGDGRTGWSPKGADEDPSPWWQVDLQQPRALSGAEVVMRWELDQPATRADLEIVGANQPDAGDAVLLARLGATPLPHRAIWPARWTDRTPYRYLRVRKAGTGYMYLGEVRVLAAP
ncbi:discoidin domain-containing protein [Nannocystis pusilla]|nr:discoidin domain-containing protein [Nannocystis pusilla]